MTGQSSRIRHGALLGILLLAHSLPARSEVGETADAFASGTQPRDEALAALLVAGPDGLDALVGGLRPPGPGDDAATRTALRALSDYVCRSGAPPEQRDLLTQALLRGLAAAEDPDVQAALFAELAWVGRPSEVEALLPHVIDDRVCLQAVNAITAIGRAYPDAEVSAGLVSLLNKVTSRNQVAVVQALGVLAASSAAGDLEALLRSEDPAVSKAARHALARIGAPSSYRIFRVPTGRSDPGSFRRLAVEALRYAGNLAASGEGAAAVKLCRTWLAATRTPELGSVHANGLRVLYETAPERAWPDLRRALVCEDISVRRAAADILLAAEDPAVTRNLLGLVRQAEPQIRAELIDLIGWRGDTAAFRRVARQLNHEDEAVRQQAVAALARLDPDQAFPLLLGRLGAARGAEARALEGTLSRCGGDAVDRQVQTGLGNGSGPAKQALLLRVASLRGMREGMDPALAAARSEEPALRKSGIEALRRLAGRDDIEALLDLLAAPRDGADRPALEAAVVASCRETTDVALRTEAVRARLPSASADERAALLRVLGGLGGDPALDAVAGDTGHADAVVADAAVRVLSQWREYAAAAALLKLAETSDNPSHHVLAMRGWIRLIDQGFGSKYDKLSEERAGELDILLRRALETARTDQEQNSVQEKIARLTAAQTQAEETPDAAPN